jgi:hypothetical protein
VNNEAVASLSLDLDDKWTYLKTHGNPAWADYPSYLHYLVPRILDFLEERDITITFFVVGRDAADERNGAALARLAAEGHEIASHSFDHDPWLHLYSESQLHEDLQRAEEAIAAATGASVEGFRGPGFSTSEATLRVLDERGYRYDATAFPNILNPLARAYFLARSDLSAEERERRKGLFGSYRDAFRPVRPYRWDLGGNSLLELPVTTMPLFKVPIHFSYLLYLGSYSPVLSRAYLRFALNLCRATRTEPSLLLHPLDFVGGDEETDLAFFPAMGMPTKKKLELMAGYVDLIRTAFRPVTMGEHVSAISDRSGLRTLDPREHL